MAIVTEEPEQEPRQPPRNSKPQPPPKPQNNTNAFTFWFYFTLSVSLLTLLSISLSSLSSSSSYDSKRWFLSLPTSLRGHYSSGRTIKVQITLNDPTLEVFTYGDVSKSNENVLVVHGLGLSSYSFRGVVESLKSRGVGGVAVDLPGSGFSDRSTVEIVGRSSGVFERLRDVYGLIQERGFFWAFDRMVETGQVPYEEIMQSRVLERKRERVVELGSEEMGRVLGQVIEALNLAPVHLVLHDSALLMTANWVGDSSGLVKSVTLLDSGKRPALPSLVLDLPLIKEVLLGFAFAYERLIRLCCVKSVGGIDVEGGRVLLKGRDGARAVTEMGRMLNYSFDVGEWGGLDGVKGLPIQVIWSSGWSKEWSEEGLRVADAVPRAKFVEHLGGRWPQVMDIKRLNNMMSDHGIYSRERLLIPISNPDILIDGTCYIELDAYAKREVAVLYLEGEPDKRPGSLWTRMTSDQGKRRIIDSLRRSMQVDDGTAQYYLSISNGDPRAALSQYSADLGWERQIGLT